MINTVLHGFRQVLNRFGYDIRRQNRGVAPLLDPSRTRISEISFAGATFEVLIANPDDAIQRCHCRGEFYEVPELEIIRDNIAADGVFVDVGANVGNHSLFAARLASKVIALEPGLLQHTLLSVNIALNGLSDKIVLHRLGLSDRAELSRLLTPNDDNLGGSRIAPESQGEFVRLAVGDEVLRDVPVTFLKIDVEGHEMKALQGLADTIARRRPKILIEVDAVNTTSFTEWCARHRYVIASRNRRYEANENFFIVSAG